MPLISTIIATRDRSLDLERCLDSLRHCELPPDWSAEVLVVENSGVEDVENLINSIQTEQCKIQFRYFYEPKRGKAFAVNSGVAQAGGSILAFTDDDTVLDKNWLKDIISEFAADESLGLLAGRVEPFGSNLAGTAVTRLSEKQALDRHMSLEGQVLGCNLAIRPLVLEKVHGRDCRLGPGRGLSGEDIDFTYRVLRAGFRGVFSPLPVVYHEPGKRDRAREYLRGWGAFYMKFIARGDGAVTRQAWWRIRPILGRLVRGKNIGDSMNDLWQLLSGALIMAKRMMFP